MFGKKGPVWMTKDATGRKVKEYEVGPDRIPASWKPGKRSPNQAEVYLTPCTRNNITRKPS